MKIRVEGAKCQSYGICVEDAPAAFVLDDWGYATATNDGAVPSEDEAKVEKAIAECPAKAIRIVSND